METSKISYFFDDLRNTFIHNRCHFNEKHIDIKEEMNIYTILDNVIEYAKNEKFKIGFVGNGEPLLDIVQLYYSRS